MNSQEDYFHLGAKALIHNEKGQMLLLQLNPNKFKNTNEARFDIPGGRVQKNETLEIALKREIYEETGIDTILSLEPFMMTLSNFRIPTQIGDVGLVFATYLCKVPENIQIRLSDEHIYFEWAEPSRVSQLLSHYPLPLLKKLSDLHKKF